MEPGNGNKNDNDGEDDGATREIQNGSNGGAAEAEEKSGNANSSNDTITKLQQTILHYTCSTCLWNNVKHWKQELEQQQSKH